MNWYVVCDCGITWLCVLFFAVCTKIPLHLPTQMQTKCYVLIESMLLTKITKKITLLIPFH